MCVILIKTLNDTWPTLKFLSVCYMHTLTKTKITRQIHVLFLFTRLLHKSNSAAIICLLSVYLKFFFQAEFKFMSLHVHAHLPTYKVIYSA